MILYLIQWKYPMKTAAGRSNISPFSYYNVFQNYANAMPNSNKNLCGSLEDFRHFGVTLFSNQEKQLLIIKIN